MMEVKQNTQMDFNNLLTTNSNSNEEDAVMEDLDSRKLKNDLLKSKDASSNGLLSSVTNGTVDNFDAVIDLDGDLDMDEPVNPELEDALLADDETDVVDKAETAELPAEELANGIAKKTETSSSTPGSDKLRNPGDDLDTLLSKINDLAKIETVVETPKDKESKVGGDDEAAAEVNTTTSEVIELDSANTTPEKNVPAQAAQSEADDEKNETVEDSSKPSEAQNSAEDEVDEEEVDEEEVDEEEAEEEEVEEAEAGEELNEADKTEIVAAKSSEENVVAKETESKQEKKVEAKEKKKNVAILTVDLDDDDDEEVAATADKEIKNKETEDVTQSDSKAGASLELEDSDDDVVFFIDKPKEAVKVKVDGICKSTKTKEKSAKAEGAKESGTKTNSSAAQKADDDDIVLLCDDDDDDNEAVKATDKAEKKKADIKEQVGDKDEVKSKLPEEKTEAVPKEKTVTLVADKVSAEETAKDANLKFDNSDNAVTAKDEEALAKETVEKTKSAEAEETNSNCSSSSNLLQEAKPAEEATEEVENENEDDEEAEAEVEAEADADAEGDDNDVELLDEIVTVGSVEPATTKEDDVNEVGVEEDTTDALPPAKRLRLSEEGEEEEAVKSSSVADESDEVIEVKEQTKSDDGESESLEATQIKEDEQKAATLAVKRSHDALDDSEVTKDALSAEETAKKKLKTDEDKEKCDTKVAVADELKTETSETVDEKDVKPLEEPKLEEQVASVTTPEEKPEALQRELKVVPSDVPIPLYPPPILDDPANVPPLKLEFFKRFRKTFDKMSKNDLEDLVLQKVVEAIVHKSEFAEMREIIEKQEKIIATHRNKITELSKQFRDLEMVHNRVVKDIETKNSQFIMPVKITRAVGLQVYIPTRKNSEPTLNATPSTSGTPSSPGRAAALTSPQRPNASEARATNSALASAAAAAAINARRGCVQKITPQRPVMVDASSTSGNAAAGVTPNPVLYRPGAVTPSPLAAPNSPRVLNKNAIPGTMGMPRSRISDPVALQQQQRQQQLLATARQQAQGNAARKLTPKNVTTSVPQYRRSTDATSSTSTGTSMSSVMDNYMTSITTSIPSTTAPSVSITPAKPKEKAVIDLTDEDDVVQAAAAARQQRLPTAPQSSVSSSVNTSTPQYTNANRSVPPLTRMPSANASTAGATNQMSANNKQIAARQLATMQSKNISSLSNTSGTSITRVHIPPENAAPQRAKYAHPAPLPHTPPQVYNSAWKLPPPRPTIRISNLENGIVISWTMEEAMDRHAECVSYQIYAYQETPGPPMLDSWRHVGDVKAMLLPMAVTLTQFQEGQRYFFAVRAVDKHQRFGPFSSPKTWS